MAKRKYSATVSDLIREQMLTPGQGALTVEHCGQVYVADLREDGRIVWEGVMFDTPSAWSLAAKRRGTPGKVADNGWSSVKVAGKGVSLATVKDRLERARPPQGLGGGEDTGGGADLGQGGGNMSAPPGKSTTQKQLGGNAVGGSLTTSAACAPAVLPVPHDTPAVQPAVVRTMPPPLVQQQSRKVGSLPMVGSRAAPALRALKPLSSGVAQQVRLEKGADPDERSAAGFTALWQAAAAGQTATCEALVRAGADLEAKGPVGDTALHVAARTGRDDVCRQLMAAGASVEATDIFGRTPAMAAALSGRASTLAVLPRSLMASDASGCTGLMLAARAGHVDCLELLLQWGAQPEVQDKQGQCALLHAVMGSEPVLRVLLRVGAAGAGGDAWADRLSAALLLAARDGMDGAVGLLLEAGALDSEGAALQAAIQAGRVRNIALLHAAQKSIVSSE